MDVQSHKMTKALDGLRDDIEQVRVGFVEEGQVRCTKCGKRANWDLTASLGRGWVSADGIEPCVCGRSVDDLTVVPEGALHGWDERPNKTFQS